MVVLLMFCVAGVVAANPAQAASASKPSARIKPVTSKITPVDVFGDGTLQPVVYVTAVVRNCPEGTYSMDLNLHQDGADVPVATTANGAGVVGCTGSRLSTFELGFTSSKLHPGRARAFFDLRPLCDTGDCSAAQPFLVKVKRFVRIPATKPQASSTHRSRVAALR